MDNVVKLHKLSIPLVDRNRWDVFMHQVLSGGNVGILRMRHKATGQVFSGLAVVGDPDEPNGKHGLFLIGRLFHDELEKPSDFEVIGLVDAP
jgi:hypothetical protein